MQTEHEFNMYLIDIISTADKLYCNYLGIVRKEYPKWQGWKVIQSYKLQNIDIKDIKDHHLDTLVKNFYYLKFIQSKD